MPQIDELAVKYEQLETRYRQMTAGLDACMIRARSIHADLARIGRSGIRRHRDKEIACVAAAILASAIDVADARLAMTEIHASIRAASQA